MNEIEHIVFHTIYITWSTLVLCCTYLTNDVRDSATSSILLFTALCPKWCSLVGQFLYAAECNMDWKARINVLTCVFSHAHTLLFICPDL